MRNFLAIGCALMSVAAVFLLVAAVWIAGPERLSLAKFASIYAVVAVILGLSALVVDARGERDG